MRILLITALCVAASVASAQSAPTSPIARGSRLISGSASITRSTFESGGAENSVTSINVNPTVLWFVRDRLAMGAELGLGHASNDNASSTSWSIGPAARWFFADLNEKTLPFAGAALLVGASSTGGSGVTTSQRAVELVAGATRLLARNLGVTGELFFVRANHEVEFTSTTSESSNTSFGLRFGISAFLY